MVNSRSFVSKQTSIQFLHKLINRLHTRTDRVIGTDTLTQLWNYSAKVNDERTGRGHV